jgi:hypothetical protein
VYRRLGGRQGQAVPGCETTLVWKAASPALARFVDFVRGQL